MIRAVIAVSSGGEGSEANAGVVHAPPGVDRGCAQCGRRVSVYRRHPLFRPRADVRELRSGLVPGFRGEMTE